MNKFLQNLIFSFKKPPVVIIFEPGAEFLIKAVSGILKKNKQILMICADSNYKKENLEFLIKKSSLPMLVFLKKENETSGLENILGLAKILPQHGLVVSDKDFLDLRKIKGESLCRILTFGISGGADIFATDINFSEEGTNLKINYEGKTVPFWFRKKITDREISIILAAILISVLNGLNLVEISQILKKYDF